MSRRRRPLTENEKAELLEKLRAFRADVVIPHSIRVPPGSAGYWKGNAVNDAILAWADELAGEKDVLLKPGHSNPPNID